MKTGTNLSWDEYGIALTKAVRIKSKDRSTQIGCVIMGPHNEIRSTGYNSFVRGADDENEARHERPEKYKWTEHAERNAIYNAASVGVPLRGCRAYISQWLPCTDCARAIIQSGITEVITTDYDLENERWIEEFEKTRQMFRECGVKITIIKDK